MTKEEAANIARLEYAYKVASKDAKPSLAIMLEIAKAQVVGA
jgi:CYTH domain-containing protein